MCDERYDEEIIRFCTKDGTPLIDDAEPSFTALPSENADAPLDEPDNDFGEETIISRKPADIGGGYTQSDQSERIVIPLTPAPEQQVRPRTTQAYYPPPPQANTAKTVVLTIIGTLIVLGFGAGLFWFLQKDKPANLNTNLNANLFNQNTNINTNIGFDSNFNFNANPNFNTNYNLNTNLNANIKTPTPTPKPSPSPSPSPSPTASPTATPTPRPTLTPRPSVSPTPRTGPRPSPLPTNSAGNNNR